MRAPNSSLIEENQNLPGADSVTGLYIDGLDRSHRLSAILISIFIASITSNKSLGCTCCPTSACRRITTPASGLRHTFVPSNPEEIPSFVALGSTAD